MNQKKTIKNVVILMLLMFGLCGCLRVDYPARKAYMLKARYPSPRKRASHRGRLQVLNVNIVPQYASNEFIYRLSDLQYTSDFYNFFFIAPSQQLTQIVTTWLQRTNLFSNVVNNSLLNPNYFLQTKVLAMYADNRYKKHVQAVLIMQFTLYHQGSAGKELMIENTYKERRTLKHQDAQGLVEMWNQEVVRIMKKFSSDLAKHL